MAQCTTDFFERALYLVIDLDEEIASLPFDLCIRS